MKEITIRIEHPVDCPYRIGCYFDIDRSGGKDVKNICGHYDVFKKYRNEKLIVCEVKFPKECPFKEVNDED